MPIKARIRSFTVNDGTNIDLPESGVVLFVGPNNAGKSHALRDLLGLSREQGEYRGTVITSTRIEKLGTHDEALEWVGTSIPTRRIDGVDRVLIDGWGNVRLEDFAQQWGQGDTLGYLSSAFILHADGTTRLTAGNAPGNVDFRVDVPTHPLQRAFRDPGLEASINDVAQTAFGKDAVVDRYAGSVIPLRIGTKPPFDHVGGMPTVEYLDALADMPTLEVQGDGFKSFLGLMMQLIAGSHQILLVDEPEAFLHPPQARLLGKLLASRAQDQQVFIATHSSDILQGALEADVPVTIIRLNRNADVNHAAVLSHMAVTELWSDSLLRYSDVLDGLFHDAVVVCESDSDCRLYAAIRDNLPRDEEARPIQLLFTHCGGKARLPLVLSALHAVQVPVVAVADFDILRDPRDMERTFQALGHAWDTHKSDHATLNAALSSVGKQPSKTAVSEAVTERLTSAEDPLSRRDIEDIRKILRSESGWDRVKQGGAGALPQGAPTAAATRIIDAAASIGLQIVSVGELERFFPQIGGHGPSWVNEVLTDGLHRAQEGAAHDFVLQVEAAARRLSSAPPA